MAQAVLIVGGRRYQVPCRDGEERRLEALGRTIDGKAAEVARAVGGTNEARLLLLAAVLLANELEDLRRSDTDAAAIAEALDTLAERVEALAGKLENDADTP